MMGGGCGCGCCCCSGSCYCCINGGSVVDVVVNAVDVGVEEVDDNDDIMKSTWKDDGRYY